MKNEVSYQKNASQSYFNVAPGVWGLKDIFVNMYIILNPFDGNWVLVDAGIKSSHSKIRKTAEQLFGPNAKPAAIILTHGHFDHVGSLSILATEWSVPVYAHYLEIPYLTGRSSYPPADPTAGGGLMSTMADIYPNAPIDVWNHINVLPPDGKVPFLPEWTYIHTPGHAPGHISLYRENDGVLIAGDAFVTTKQESLFSVITQMKKLSGPPKYFTYDWGLARNSLRQLVNLHPEVVATGHGKPMNGTDMRRALHYLSDHFESKAMPKSGRYVNEPAVTDANGVVYIPPRTGTTVNKLLKILTVTAAAATVGLLIYGGAKKKVKKKKDTRPGFDFTTAAAM